MISLNYDFEDLMALDYLKPRWGFKLFVVRLEQMNYPYFFDFFG